MPQLATAKPKSLQADSSIHARPFLKWVGGKGQLLDQLQPLLPGKYGAYFEPFIGGGAMFFGLPPHKSSLSDVNAELIDCYQVVRDQVEPLIKALAAHRYESSYFYSVRQLDPTSLPLVERAARTIFLNKTGFNGLYRVNQGGRFNVPFGRYTNPTICDPTNLRACSARLQGVKLAVRNFDAVLTQAKRDDLVYFDPPYVPVSQTSYFTSYSAKGFGWDEQQRLAEVFRALARKGVHALLSNSDTPEVRELYREFQIESVQASRSVNANAARRGKVGEVVVRSLPKQRKRLSA